MMRNRNSPWSVETGKSSTASMMIRSVRINLPDGVVSATEVNELRERLSMCHATVLALSIAR